MINYVTKIVVNTNFREFSHCLAIKTCYIVRIHNLEVVVVFLSDSVGQLVCVFCSSIAFSVQWTGDHHAQGRYSFWRLGTSRPS